jgi:hypothetical protein
LGIFPKKLPGAELCGINRLYFGKISQFNKVIALVSGIITFTSTEQHHDIFTPSTHPRLAGCGRWSRLDGLRRRRFPGHRFYRQRRGGDRPGHR